MGYNLPDDVREDDPRAPWNQPDAEFTEWEEHEDGTCNWCDKEGVPVDEEGICEECFELEEIE